MEDDCNCSAEHKTTQNPLNKIEARIVLQMSVENWHVMSKLTLLWGRLASRLFSEKK